MILAADTLKPPDETMNALPDYLVSGDLKNRLEFFFSANSFRNLSATPLSATDVNCFCQL
jgi:hypothetical protein